MAYKSFNQRFPKFKWVLLVAILITLSLTVFSAQQKTSTEEHAASSQAVCGPNGKSPVCGVGFSCSYTAGNPDFGGTCIPSALSKPTGLKSYFTYCKPPNLPEYDTINFNWSHVKDATGYTLYYRVYASGNSYTLVSRPGYNNLTYLLTKLKNLKDKRVQWYVKATNSYTSNQSNAITTGAKSLSCEG